MRVLFVNPGVDLGGAEQSLLLLLEGLKAQGLEPVVALFGDGPFRDRLASLGIPTLHIGPAQYIRGATRYRLSRGPLRVAHLVAAGLPSALSLAMMARKVGVDLIHTNGLKAHLLGGFAGRLIGTPVIWHLRDFPPDGVAGRVFRIAARRLPRLILANSDAVAAAIRPSVSARPRVVRLYNPVDLHRFRPGLPRERIRRELGLGLDAPLVGLVAHLTPWKGHELFLDIAREVVRSVPAARFVIAGGAIYETDGHAGYLDALHRCAEALGLGDRLAFLGARDDVPEVLTDLDVLVHCPTAPEPFGRVLAEAMAVGRPVVGARCGGIPEVVGDGVTGFLAPSGDVSGFAELVVRLLENPNLRERLGKAGRRRAEALFGEDTHTLGVLEAYRAVVAGRGVAA